MSIPGAAFTVIPHAAHLANLERPAEVNAALLGHLKTAQ
jgi:3-oxoadipate enol-lactonase/4-carboxymuconolactone decarboxylase